MEYKGAGEEVLGYYAVDWMEFAKAQKALSAKRDVSMLKSARDLYKELEKQGVWEEEEEEKEKAS